MTAFTPEPLTLAGLMAAGAGRGRAIATPGGRLPLDAFADATSLGADLAALEGRSVLLRVGDMAFAAAALIDLDGAARRITLLPPGVDASAIAAILRDAEIDALVFDQTTAAPDCGVALAVECRLALRPLAGPRAPPRRSEWALMTSGTTGRPKLVAHDLASLTSAIAPAARQEWGTFYDIRRYGGLQIFLRTLCGVGSLTLSGPGEPVESFLARLAAAGATHISGTPTHWRKALMAGAAGIIDPAAIRLSGEIADQGVLDALRAAFPRAEIAHAYASSEGGVGFAVSDGLAGFPATLVGAGGDPEFKVVDGSLWLRSKGAASRYLGDAAPALRDPDGFVDSGDAVERRGGRYVFLGRRGGIINVGGAKAHPEEIEAVINAVSGVRASRVFARKNPITGALVAAEVVLAPPARAEDEVAKDIREACRARLEPYKTPSTIRFVPDLAATSGGKLSRHG